MRFRELAAVSAWAPARFGLRSLMRVSGRSFTYRVGRLLMNEARFDLVNDPRSNGERGVQKVVLGYRQPGFKTVVFDVGANVGDWTRSLLAQIPLEPADDSSGIQVHVFEPCAGTFEILRSRIRALSQRASVAFVRKGCSGSSGTGVLHMVGIGAGTNSVVQAEDTEATEQIELISIDDYCHGSNIDHICLLKIDAEGHDAEVIKGASRMLQERNIEVLQFEYNQRWIHGGAFLRDAFNILCPFGYTIGKVTPYGVEFYQKWDWELETFREGNYLACLPQWISRFKSIAPSWNPRLLAASRES